MSFPPSPNATDPPTLAAAAARGAIGRSFELEGKVAVVTGGGGTLMSETAAGLASAGAAVAVVDLRREPAERVAAAINAGGGRAIALACDVGDESAVEATFAAVDEAFGRVDVMVNGVSAGIRRAQPEELALADWQVMLGANLTGYFLCARAAGRRMIAAGRGGSVVNVASIGGVNALGRGATHYGVAKAGVLQLTRELAVAWARHGVRVNSILPCQFINGWWGEQLAATEKTAMVRRVVDGIPMGRLGEPREIVGPILFLASDAASMVTGIALPVDGGNLALNAGGSVEW